MKSTTKASQHKRDYENRGYLDGRCCNAGNATIFFWKKMLNHSFSVVPLWKHCETNCFFVFFSHIGTFISHTKSQLSLRKETRRGSDTWKESTQNPSQQVQLALSIVFRPVVICQSTVQESRAGILITRGSAGLDFQWTFWSRRTIWCNLVHHHFLSPRMCSFGMSFCSNRN